MARRRSFPHARTDDEATGLAVVLLVVVTTGYRTLGSVDWRVLLTGASLALSVVFLIVRALLRAARRRELVRLTLVDARALSPDDFERRVAALLYDR